MTVGEFDVVEFYGDGASSFVECNLAARTALTVAGKRIRKAGNRYSNVARVVITDGRDVIVFEWQRRVGIVFPANFTGAL
jgi:hypothetical protein